MGDLEPESAQPPAQRKNVWVHDSIAFSCDDLKGIRTPHDDPVVISLINAKHDIKWVLVDNGSSTNILFYDAFQRMKMLSHWLQAINAPLVGFTGNSIQIDRAIALPVTARTKPCHTIVTLTFLMVWVPSTYNAILDRPGLNAFRAVISNLSSLNKISNSQRD